MPELNFTPEQRAAIDTRGSTVLVSAAAGSGKTRVLTERLMAYLTDAENPVDIDRFLVITYTRAAAAELRSRILDWIYARIASDPENRRLRRQVALCARADAFLDHLESLTEDEDNHFSRADVKDALRALKGDRKRLSTIASREWIEDNTKVTIPANKRNYRKQEAHLYLARRKKEDMKVIGEVVKEGRPTAERTVREWQESHPAGKKADCIRETGLAKHTVYKWWK